MMFFLYNLRLWIGRIVLRKSSLLMLLLPIFCLVLSQKIDTDELGVSLPVGIVIPQNSQYGEDFYALLRHENGLIEYYQTDADTLYEKVAVGEFACGFILNSDFDSRIEKSRYTKIFTMVMTENSTAATLVSEAISGAMISLVAENIAVDFLEDRGIEVTTDAFDDEAVRVEIIENFVGDGRDVSASTAVFSSAVDGIFAVFLTIFALAFSTQIYAWRRSAIYRRSLALSCDFMLTLPILLAFALVIFALSVLSYALMGTLAVLPILAFSLCLVCIAELFSRLAREFVILAVPFLAVLMLIATPIFFDISKISPICGILSQVFPATHFMSMMAGSGGYFETIVLSFCCISIAQILSVCYNKGNN